MPAINETPRRIFALRKSTWKHRIKEFGSAYLRFISFEHFQSDAQSTDQWTTLLISPQVSCLQAVAVIKEAPLTMDKIKEQHSGMWSRLLIYHVRLSN